MASISHGYRVSPATTTDDKNRLTKLGDEIAAGACGVGAVVFAWIAGAHAMRILDGNEQVVRPECASVTLDPRLMERICQSHGLPDAVVLGGAGTGAIFFAGLAAYLLRRASKSSR